VRVGGALGLLVLVAPALASGLGRATAVPVGPLPLTPGPAGLCAGATTSGSFTGSLGVDGGGSNPPTVAGVEVALSYWVDLNFTPANGTSLFSCVPESATANTDGTGGLALSAPLPTSTCDRFSCSIYAGPFGPLVFTVPNGTPPGYFLTQSVSGSQVGLAFVHALTSTRLAPASRVTLSADAPTTVRAYPTAGNGAPSPASVGYAWQLLGNGWSLLNGSGTATVTIVAFDLASPGTLTVWANGSYNGTAVAAPPVTLEIAAASTTLAQFSVDPTSLDVGYPATFTVTGEGAGGYPYEAYVSPGLGVATTAAPCTTAVVAGGLVSLTCAVSLAYNRSGTAVPTANLTNGFSSATQSFHSVTVGAALGLAVSPANAVAYVDAPVAVTVTADTSTGTGPQGPACLWPGNGRVLCDPGPGPSYPFSVEYGSAGSFSGKATLGDASEANASVPYSATVYERPTLSTFVASTNTLAVGQSATIVGSVSGGALPMTYWWNSSQPAGTLYEGTLTADGTLEFTFVPHVAGPTTITLYVLDSLGTVIPYPTSMNVTAGPATNVVARVGGGGALVAGAPTSISWTAVNPDGEPVGSWSGPAAIVLGPASSDPTRLPTMWVNISGVPVPSPDGVYQVNASAWSLGVLRCTVDFAGAGAFVLTLDGGLPPLGGGSNAIALSVGPNTSAPVLSHPTVVTPGARANRTLWQIADRFGDPLVGASIHVDTIVDGAWSNNTSWALGSASTGTSVWVNYSVPENAGATVFVLSSSGGSLLPPISILAPSTGPVVPVAWLLVAVGAAMAAASAIGLWGRARRPGPTPESAPSEVPASEDELRRWAEGRAHVLQRSSGERGETLDELAKGFVGRPPRPDEMTEWVASLVADGSLRTVLGDDGRSRFVKVGDDAPPRVELDDRALADALDRRAALDASDGPDGEERA